QGVEADVVAVALAAVLTGLGRRHGAAARPAVQDPLEQTNRWQAHLRPLGRVLPAQQVPRLLSGLGAHGGRVVPLVNLLVVGDLGGVQDVGQQMVPLLNGLPPRSHWLLGAASELWDSFRLWKGWVQKDQK